MLAQQSRTLATQKTNACLAKTNFNLKAENKRLIEEIKSLKLILQEKEAALSSLQQSLRSMCGFDVWSNFEKGFPQFNRFRYRVKQSFSITFSVIISGFFMDCLRFFRFF